MKCLVILSLLLPLVLSDCSAPSYDGQFEINFVKPSAPVLKHTELHDNDGRTGYITDYHEQLQFDKPVQPGALYTSGFTLCNNGSIALRGTTNFYQCEVNGFYNVYFENWTSDCQLVNIEIIPCNGPFSITSTTSSTTSSTVTSSTASTTSSSSTSATTTSSTSMTSPSSTTSFSTSPSSSTSIISSTTTTLQNTTSIHRSSCPTLASTGAVTYTSSNSTHYTFSATSGYTVTGAEPTPTAVYTGGASLMRAHTLAGFLVALVYIL